VNEQQVADLFSEQIDRLLGGEAVAEVPGIDDWPELVTIGEQLSQVGFQPTPVAQAAFDSQLATWFGPGASAAFLGMSKSTLLGLGAAIMAIGAGIGLVLFVLPGIFSSDPAGELPASTTVESPAPPALSTVDTSEAPRNPTRPSSPSSVGDSLPDTDFSQRDTLPPATPQRGDTLPTVTPTSTPTATATSTSPTEPAADYHNDEPGSGDTGDGPAQGDHDDRGHGNDPDRYDEDNPGKSTGAGPDNNQGGGKKK